MDPLKEFKNELFHITLTLGDIDALVKAARSYPAGVLNYWESSELETAIQKLDDAVNG